MFQKGLTLILTVILIAIVGGYLLYQRQLANQPSISGSIPKPRSAEDYCNLKSQDVVSITDCREYKIVNYGCCDRGQAILDQNWDQIDSCGGLGEWSEKCKEKYSKKDACTVNLCKEVNQKELEETYCAKDEDCGMNFCDGCKAMNKKYIPVNKLACMVACPQTKCISNKCTSIPNAH